MFESIYLNNNFSAVFHPYILLNSLLFLPRLTIYVNNNYTSNVDQFCFKFLKLGPTCLMESYIYETDIIGRIIDKNK